MINPVTYHVSRAANVGTAQHTATPRASKTPSTQRYRGWGVRYKRDAIASPSVREKSVTAKYTLK
jgi:hypothetical protein